MAVNTERLYKFIEENVNKYSLKRVRIDKLEKLANRLAYLYCKEFKEDYHAVKPVALDRLRRIRCRPEYYNVELDSRFKRRWKKY
ncbi:hypothetical protein SAMN06265361_10454 [Laceyella tengchongensis]|jgi:hypothetical protein|uniref:Uncharacterized protein n=1 Tax=Laceyella tengchongensis TaxID=574699 RepID=A0AA45WPM0_9BACL|nr:hypothetical protein SAMN06265361_10454 [Laceyella tengchongensis]